MGTQQSYVDRASSELAQADLAFLMARLVGRPSDDQRILLDAFSPNIAAALEALDVGPIEVLKDRLAGVASAARAVALGDWADEYNRLFDTTVACPINEAGYVRRDKGAILGDIAGFYRAFGFKLSEAAGERVDHLACELEFVGMLLVMLHRARFQGDAEGEQVTADALRAFLAEHLGEWLPAFCARLSAMSALPLFVELAGLLEALWAVLQHAHHIQVVSSGALGVDEDPGTPYECGEVPDPTELAS